MQRRYITVDVFTDRAFGGNPLAVVLDAGGLSTGADAGDRNRVQLFRDDLRAAAAGSAPTTRRFASSPCARKFRSPAIPMSAPPSCWRRRRQSRRRDSKFEEKAGLVPVEILTEQGRVIGAELTAPQPLKRLTQVGASRRRPASRCRPTMSKTDRHPPQIVSVGPAVPDGGSRLARGAEARQAGCRGVRRTFPRDGSDAVYFYTRDVPAAEQPLDLQARMFHPGSSGLSEDPATGSATAAAAALLADSTRAAMAN